VTGGCDVALLGDWNMEKGLKKGKEGGILCGEECCLAELASWW